MTVKQRLRAHLDERHTVLARTLPTRATLADLQRAHARDHHRRNFSHTHGGTHRGTGADDRPESWYTGGDVCEV